MTDATTAFAELRSRIRQEHREIEALLMGGLAEYTAIQKQLWARMFAVKCHHEAMKDLAAKAAQESGEA